jgi:hypothetical protein
MGGMAEIPIPFTNEGVDTDDDTSSILMTVGATIAGFALFAWSEDVGTYLASRANGAITNALGVDPTTGEDAESGADML